MYNQHARGMATTQHRSLVERGGRKAFVRDKDLAHTPKRGEKRERIVRRNLMFTNLKTKDSSK